MGRGSRSITRWQNDRQRKKKARDKRKSKASGGARPKKKPASPLKPNRAE